MNGFSERLKELMEENEIDAKKLAKLLNLPNTSTIYNWLRNEKGISVDIAINICDLFNCSLDCLYSRSDDDTFFVSNKNYPPFDVQLKLVLQKLKISQYQLLKDKIISRGNLSNWFKRKSVPHMESVIKLAEYLEISLDELVGREKQKD